MIYACEICGASVKESMDLTFTAPIEGRTLIIANLSGEICPKCGEAYFDPESDEKIDEIWQKFKQPSIVFERKLTQSGGRRVVGIPLEIENAILKGKKKVKIWLEGGNIIVRPV